MREMPFAATQAETLPGGLPTVSPPAQRGVAGHSVAKFPHRRVFVLTAWRSAHAWITLAYPGGLDSARAELEILFPELAANIDHLERAAQQAATTFESEPAATPDAFTRALAAWERAAMDALAALDCTHPREASHV